MSIISPILLASCSSEQLARMEANSQRRQQEFLANKFSQIQATCDRYGFRRGTIEYSQCLQQAEAQWDANYNASIQQTNQAFKNMNDALKPPVFLPPPCNGGMMPTTGRINCN